MARFITLARWSLIHKRKILKTVRQIRALQACTRKSGSAAGLTCRWGWLRSARRDPRAQVGPPHGPAWARPQSPVCTCCAGTAAPEAPLFRLRATFVRRLDIIAWSTRRCS